MSFSSQCTVVLADSYEQFLGIMKESSDTDQVLVLRGDAVSPQYFGVIIREAKGIVSDMDGTIWPGSGWAYAREHWQLTEDRRQESIEADAYFANSYNTQKAQIKFALDPVVRMARFGLTRDMIHQAARQWPVREGIPELFACFKPHEIAVNSYGLFDPIRALFIESMRYNPNALPAIYALRMLWDQDGRLIGSDRTTVVTDLMKSAVLAMHAAQLGVEACDLIAIGDSPSDDFIRHGIGIAVVPREKRENFMSDLEGGKRESHRLRGLQKMWEMSCAVALGSLMPIAQIRRGVITL